MAGEVGILNVGAGDISLSFDQTNPAECIRAARIVKDMLRRGYALLVEVERDGVKKFERALDFKEDTYKYIIADFDPVIAEERDAWDEAAKQRRAEEKAYGEETPLQSIAPAETPAEKVKKKNGRRKGGKGTTEVDAGKTRAVAVGRSSGG